MLFEVLGEEIGTLFKVNILEPEKWDRSVVPKVRSEFTLKAIQYLIILQIYVLCS
jgi:hypothetical protein